MGCGVVHDGGFPGADTTGCRVGWRGGKQCQAVSRLSCEDGLCGCRAVGRVGRRFREAVWPQCGMLSGSPDRGHAHGRLAQRRVGNALADMANRDVAAEAAKDGVGLAAPPAEAESRLMDGYRTAHLSLVRRTKVSISPESRNLPPHAEGRRGTVVPVGRSDFDRSQLKNPVRLRKSVSCRDLSDFALWNRLLRQRRGRLSPGPRFFPPSREPRLPG